MLLSKYHALNGLLSYIIAKYTRNVLRHWGVPVSVSSEIWCGRFVLWYNKQILHLTSCMTVQYIFNISTIQKMDRSSASIPFQTELREYFLSDGSGVEVCRLCESDSQYLFQFLSPLLNLKPTQFIIKRNNMTTCVLFHRNNSVAHLWKYIASDSFCDPGCLVKFRPPLFFWVSDSVRHQLQKPAVHLNESTMSNNHQSLNLNVLVYLQVSALRLEPVLNELLGVVTEAQHEVSLGLQSVDGFNSLVDLMMKNVKV